MIEINRNFNNLKKNYLFVDMNRKIKDYISKNPCANIIKMGIGDVTLPLCPAVIEAMHSAVDEMANVETFRGYGPHEGYDFLRSAIANEYKSHGVELKKEEIYISDGAKNDTAGLLDVFSAEGDVLIPDPAYPAYVDSATISGKNICYIDATEENDFLPLPDSSICAGIIYICSPNNPTGATYNKAQLKKWVDYAIKNKAVIIFDAAYEAFIEDPELPHSIFEIDGAQNCAVEVRSFSKNAGFTGIRCAYTVVPDSLKVNGVSVGETWLRRQCAKFNGVSYITQKAALAVFSEEGKKQINESVAYYKKNAQFISETLKSLNIWHIGGKNSPYVWLRCPQEMNSWEFFDYLLDKVNIVGTPGSGFGPNGEGFFRLSAFNTYQNTIEAVERLKRLKF